MIRCTQPDRLAVAMGRHFGSRVEQAGPVTRVLLAAGRFERGQPPRERSRLTFRGKMPRAARRTEHPLERAALEWIASYWNADHLVRTRDWVVELDPDAGLALRLAGLTHDIERNFPGGPTPDLSDPDYERVHAERSARIVRDWLASQDAADELVAAVGRLVAAHEAGGWREADLLQAADSLAFLEVNATRPAAW